MEVKSIKKSGLETEVRAEYKRLFALLDEIPGHKLKLATKLIERAAFLSVMITRMEKDIAVNGYEEEYQNGANQSGKKKTAAAELHVSYTKNLLAVMKQLGELLPAGAEPGTGDEFDQF